MLRSAIELGTVIGVAAVNRNYGSATEQRAVDGGVVNALRAVLSTDRIRFDDNDFGTNLLLHPLGGLSYYGIPRANGATATTSFLTLLLTSLVWEQIVEMREVSSINDHIVTPVSGWVLGESLFQSRMVFRRGAPTLGNRIGSGFFGLPIALSEIVAPRAKPVSPGIDDQGLPVDVERRFRFYLASSQGRSNLHASDWTRYAIGVESEVSSPVRNAGAVHSSWVTGVAKTRFDLRVSFDPAGRTELRSFAMVMPAAWQRSASTEDKGWSLMVGPAGAWELITRGIGPGDQALGATLVGGSGDLRLMRRRWQASAGAGLFANFAATTSAGAIGASQHEFEAEPRVLRQYGYYFGYGSSFAARAAARTAAFELRTELRRHLVRSLNGISPQSDSSADGLPKRDSWSLGSLQLGWQPARNVEISIGLEGRRWHGSLGARSGDVTETGWEFRLSAAR